MVPSLGDIVIVSGYRGRVDGSNEEPGIVNSVTLNPTAEDLQQATDATEKVAKLSGDTSVKDILRQQNTGLSAEVSPCTIDVAIFPYRADHRNIQDVPFFESKEAAMEHYNGQPPATKNAGGATGCVAYFREDEEAEESVISETAESKRATEKKKSKK